MDGYTEARPVQAEGRRVGFTVCVRCGSTILIDEDIDRDIEAVLPAREDGDKRPAVVRLHDSWHERTDNDD